MIYFSTLCNWFLSFTWL